MLDLIEAGGVRADLLAHQAVTGCLPAEVIAARTAADNQKDNLENEVHRYLEAFRKTGAPQLEECWNRMPAEAKVVLLERGLKKPDPIAYVLRKLGFEHALT